MAPVGQTTLLALVNSSAVLADQPVPSTTTYIQKATWVEWVNAACQELYDLLIEAYGDDYFFQATPQSITADGSASSYALADDFYKLFGVDHRLTNDTTGWRDVPRFNFADRNRHNTVSAQVGWVRSNFRYRLQGTRIAFVPMPAGGTVFRVHYAPRFTPLAADGDAFDGILGWEEYVKAAVAMKALGKEESDQAPAAILLARQQKRIEDIKARDLGQPSTTVDVYRPFGIDPAELW